MGFLWIFYWLTLFSLFAFGIYCIIKKHILSGTLHCGFLIAFTYVSIQIGINSGYSGKGESEFVYFIDRLFSLKFDALLLVLLLIFVLGSSIYHIAMIYDEKQKEKKK